MVESLDAYRIARFLRNEDKNILSMDDVLIRYCAAEPLNEAGFPIYMLRTKEPDDSCVFLENGACKIYPVRPWTCRVYPFSIGPGSRGRDFEYVICMDRHQEHFSNGRVLVKDWLHQNFSKEDKNFLREEYAFIPNLGHLLRDISPALSARAIFLLQHYCYSNFDLEQPFLPQYMRNNAELLRQLHQLRNSIS